MKMLVTNCKLTNLVMLIIFACLLFVGGCARYAHNVDTLYEPSATIHNGTGEVFIVIPENQQTKSSDIKWALGNVTDDENRKIDEITCPRSPAEIIQTAIGLELKRAGYTVIPTTKHREGELQIIDLTKTEIELQQVSSLTDLKAKCRVLVAMDVFKNGKLVKKLQYESTSSNIDIKGRDMLAKNVLEDAVQSVVLKAVPDLHVLFKK